MVLAAPDLDRLEADITESRLPDTEGFFFGDADGSETADDLTFIGKARAGFVTSPLSDVHRCHKRSPGRLAGLRGGERPGSYSVRRSRRGCRVRPATSYSRTGRIQV